MRLLDVELHNVGPFPGKVGPISLDRQGLVSILGDNQVDPGFSANDVGKSAFVDAILWVLFGETAPRKESATSERGLGADDIVNTHVGKNAFGLLCFEGNDGRFYRVRRWRKVGKKGVGGWILGSTNGVLLEELIEGTEATIADLDKGNVQDEIDRRLGLDLSLACRVLVRSQEDSWSFVQATPKQRHDLLTEIEGREELDVWTGLFSKKASETEHAITVTRTRIEEKRARIVDSEKQAKSAAENQAQWEDGRALRVERVSTALKAHEATHEAVRAKAATLPALQEQVAQATRDETAIGYPQKPEGLDGWEARVGDLTSAVAILDRRIKDKANQIANLLSKLGAKCSACGQALPSDPAHIEAHRVQLEAEIQNARAERETNATALVEARKVVTDGTNAWHDMMQATSTRRAELAALRATATAALRAVDMAGAQLPGMVTQRARLADALTTELNAANPFTQILAQVTAGLDGHRTELTTLTSDYERFSVQSGLMSWWVRAIPSIKAWLFDTACADITAETNRWLTIFTQGMFYVAVEASSVTKAGDVRDKVGLRVVRRGPDGVAAEVDFRKLGGGAKRRIIMAVEWAIASRLQRRAKTRTSFLVLDEVDRHLDDAGRSGLLQALNVLRAEKETILVISHDPAFKAAPDKKLLVTKTRDGSKIEVLQ